MNAKKAPPAHLQTGLNGEEHAAAYLRGQGLRILERNWRPKGGPEAHLEIDLIASDGEDLLFVEVKTRSYAPASTFTPQDAFGKAKRERLLKAAALYLGEKDAWSVPCRFDLITVIIYPDKTCKLEQIKDVIPFSGRGAMGGGNTPWQPW